MATKVRIIENRPAKNIPWWIQTQNIRPDNPSLYFVCVSNGLIRLDGVNYYAEDLYHYNEFVINDGIKTEDFLNHPIIASHLSSQDEYNQKNNITRTIEYSLVD
jgi:hypothetical protein